MPALSPDTGAPLVSILIPVYNRPAFLEECAASALAQDFTDFEVVICDNHSTDGTWKICRQLAAGNPGKVRIFQNEENVGPVRNWKKCLAEARGRIAKILFSDDLIFPEFLSRTVPFLERDDVGFAFTQAEVGSRRRTGEVAWKWRAKTDVYPAIDFQKDLLLGTGKVPVSPGCALFRTEDLRRNLWEELPTGLDLSEYGAGADALLYLLTSRDRPMVAHIAEPLCFFRRHDDSITVRGHGGKVRDGYFETYLYFANFIGRADWLIRLQAKLWILEMWRAGRLLTPATALSRFRTAVASSWRILPHALREAVIQIRHKMGLRWSRRSIR